MSCHHHDLGSTSDRSCREKYFLQPITNIRWLVGTKHVPESKNTFQSPKRVPESKNSSQNPKDFPDSKNTSRIQNTSKIQKHFSESKTRSRVQNTSRIQNTSIRESKSPCNNPKHVPKTKNTVGFWEVFWFRDMFLDSGKCLDSGTCFWILGRVLDFVKCFFYSGTSYGFWEVFCPYQTRYKHYPDQGSNTCDCNDLYSALVPHIIIL